MCRKTILIGCWLILIEFKSLKRKKNNVEIPSDGAQVLALSLFIILLAFFSKTENVIKAKQAGVNNYIVKPFNADTLRGKIESVIK